MTEGYREKEISNTLSGVVWIGQVHIKLLSVNNFLPKTLS